MKQNRISQTNGRITTCSSGQSLLMALLLFILLLSWRASAQCTYDLSTTNRLHGPGATNSSVIVTAPSTCGWFAENTNLWIQFTGATSGIGNGSVPYRIDANPDFVERTGIVMIANQICIIRQRAFECSYDLSPQSKTHGPGLTNASFSVETSSNCTWAVHTTNNWIEILDPVGAPAVGGPGNGSVSYEVAFNTFPVWRTGSVMVADQVFVIAQRPSSCMYSLSPTNQSRDHGYRSATNNISITTGPSCSWSVDNTNAWIVFEVPTGSGNFVSTVSGNGSSSIRYVISQNPAGIPRSGVLDIAGELFTINQAEAPCNYLLTPTNGNHSAEAETGTVFIATLDGCPWTVINTNTWVTIVGNTNGVGQGEITYTIPANRSITSTRTGYLNINGEAFRIRQQPATCRYQLGASQRDHGPGANTASVSLTTNTTGGSCSWRLSIEGATPGDPRPDWLSITTATIGVGNTTVGYSFTANPSPLDRTGLLIVRNGAGSVVDELIINQSGITCDFDLSPAQRTNSYNSVLTNNVNIFTAGACPWGLINTNPWITIISPTNGFGNGSFSYLLARNPAAVERTGYITLVLDPSICASCEPPTGELAFRAVQRAAPCDYSLSRDDRTHGYGAVTATVDVVTAIGCPWSLINTNPWVTILEPLTPTPSGPGQVKYALQANTSGSTLSGNLTIAGLNFALTHLAISCTNVISPLEGLHSALTETGTVSVTTAGSCSWQVENTNDWITILAPVGGSDSGNGQVRYVVSPNTAQVTRSATIIIAGELFTVTQSAYDCNFKLSATTREHGYPARTDSLTVTTTSNCVWTVQNTNPWVTINIPTGVPPTGGPGNGPISYSIELNEYPVQRTGFVTVGDHGGGLVARLSITQRAFPCQYQLSPTNRNHGDGPTNRTFDIRTDRNCPWTVLVTNEWVRITSDTSGTGSNTVAYAVDANETLSERFAVITIQDPQSTVLGTFHIKQSPLECVYDVQAGSPEHGYRAATNSVPLECAPVCPWTVHNTNSWITLLSHDRYPVAATNGTGDALIHYRVEANPDLVGRTGIVMIADQAFIIRQKPLVCDFSVSPRIRPHGFGQTNGVLDVDAPPGCLWFIENTNNWIIIDFPVPPDPGSGPGNVNYSIMENANPNSRTGMVMIADQIVEIRQRGFADTPFQFEIVNPQPGGFVHVRLIGAPAGVWELQGSSNLVNWTHVALMTNTAGLVDYVDRVPVERPCQFYRAILQP